MPTTHYKIVLAGPMGAGKTTAIRAISEIEPIDTEAFNTERERFDKVGTTVAMDYGELTISDDEKLMLYGAPGQERFDFMWPILAKGALGILLLINNAAPDPLDDLVYYATRFRAAIAQSVLVVGVGRTEQNATPSLGDHADRLAALGIFCPVLAVDVRRQDDVLLLMDALLTQIETGLEQEVTAA